MKNLLISIVILFLLAGCQEGHQGGQVYTNPQQFDDSRMATVMIDQGVYLRTVDDLEYDEDDSFWNANHSVQNNLVILSGTHSLGLSSEKYYHHLYLSKTLQVEFEVEPGQIYRVMKTKNEDGRLVIGVFHRKQLIAQTSLE